MDFCLWHVRKDLFWYSRDTNSRGLEQAALKAEIQKVKEEEEQLMREALGLAPKRSDRPRGNRLDKHELSELVKRGSTAEDLGGGHAEAAKVDGLGFARAPRAPDTTTSVLPGASDVATEMAKALPEDPEHMDQQPEPVKEDKQKKRKHEKHDERKHDERRHERHEDRKHKKHEKRHSRDLNDKSKRRKDENKKRRD
ncbi:Lysophospholipase nte1 [Bienertia sinuspersici]